ncbi:MAG TPA: acetylxylan esterase [Tepidisphaeraceae bacterium]|nr:acetylxylan esterase [Tepidisphaeraceae bacterium]
MHHHFFGVAAGVCLWLGIVLTALGAQPQSQPQPEADYPLPYHVDHPWPFKAEFGDQADWERRAEELRTQTLVATGLWPMPEKTPLNPVIHGRMDRDDYTIEKVFFASLPGHYVTGNLYRPKNGVQKRPAVLSPYGHWPDGRFIWRSDADAQKQIDAGAEKTINGARSPLQARCAMLARMGCVVFHYDMLGYGDSTAIKHREGFDDVEATLRLQSQLGLQTWNAIRALDFLASLPDVDPSRLAVTGASGGGTQTILVSALDPRVAVSFPHVMVSMSMQGGCVCENAPLLRVGTNNVELACLFAPKPLGMGAANDWTKDLETTGLPEAKRIYELYGKPQLVSAKHFPFEHNFNQVSREYMYEWLNRHLNLGWESPVREKPFEPVPPEQLSVFDPQHPLPNDALDAAALRKQMTKASDKQVAAMSVQDLRRALRAMLVYPLPGEETEGLKYDLRKPEKWNGRIVVWIGELDDPTTRRFHDAGVAIMTTNLPSANNPVKVKRGSYAGFTLGYNRSNLARQAVTVLRLIDAARNQDGAKSIDLVGPGSAVLLARAATEHDIANTIIDLERFDFDQIKEPSDPRILPGALKYGGVFGFARLCTGGRVLLTNAPRSATVAGVTIQEAPLDLNSTISQLLQ